MYEKIRDVFVAMKNPFAFFLLFFSSFSKSVTFPEIRVGQSGTFSVKWNIHTCMGAFQRPRMYLL